MTRMISLLSLLFAGLVASTAVQADDEAAIRALYAQWDKAVAESSISGYTAVLDDNIRLVLPGAPDVVGRDNYAAFLENVLPVAQYTLTQLGDLQLTVIGDLALTEYHKRVEMQLNSDQGVSEPGALTANVSVNKYIDVLRRQADGSWRVYRHAWTASEHAE